MINDNDTPEAEAPETEQPDTSSADSQPNATPQMEGNDWASIFPQEAQERLRKEFRDPEAFLKKHDNLNKLMGRGKVALPHANDSQDEIDAFNKAIGVPDNAEYNININNLNLPKEILENEERMQNISQSIESLKKHFYEAGVRQDNAEKFVSGLLALSMEKEQERVAAMEQSLIDRNRQLQEKMGINYKRNLEAARWVAREFGRDTAFENFEPEKNPELTELFAMIGNSLSDAKFRTGFSASQTPQTAQDVSDDYTKFLQDNREALNNRNHADHARAVEESRRLVRRLAELQNKS